MAIRPLPDAEYLRQCLDYDPDTGVLTWRERPREHFPDERAWKIWNTKNAGKPAGTPRRRYVGIHDHPRMIHRVIWKLVTGKEPPRQIDHRDQDFMNNRWNNLREATGHENQRNRGAQSNNTTGFKGVSKYDNRFRARIFFNGKTRCLGSFRTAEAAHAAYCTAAREHHGDFWSAGSPVSKNLRITRSAPVSQPE
jgi:hypothetical protein